MRSNLENIRRITIVGGGFSGALILAEQVRQVQRLLQTGQRPQLPNKIKITIVDPSVRVGPGNPYQPILDSYLLNQPAYAMSPFADEPNHFVKWLEKRNVQEENLSHSFQPRKLYGEYLTDIFDEARKIASNPDFPVEITHAQTSVSSADFSQAGSVIVQAENGESWESDSLIIADGHHKNELLSSLQTHPNYHDGILDCSTFQFEKPKRVLIVGSGQDMMDRLSDLHHCGYEGIIDVVSRNGVLPWTFNPALYAPEREISPYQLSFFTVENLLKKTTFNELNALWNKELLHALETGYGYAHVLGAFYSNTDLQELNRSHPAPQEWRKQLDYVQAFYGNPTPKIRHALLEKLIQSERLKQKFSSVSEDKIVQHKDGSFEVIFDDGTTEHYDAIINSASCARSLKDKQGEIRSPLIASFNKAGLINWDCEKTGIIHAGQQKDLRLFYAGPYSYPGKWGVETFRKGHAETAINSLLLCNN